MLKLKKFIYNLLNPPKMGRKAQKKTRWYAFKYRFIHPILIARKPKIFCIGMNKTGTTSLAEAMEDLGYLMGKQYEAEHFLLDWEKRDFRRIKAHCRHAQFFQDVPFSMPDTYKVMDESFKGAKFILTIRDDADQWVNSLIKFHTKLWSPDENPPRKEHLLGVDRRYKGWAWDLVRLSYETSENDLYNREELKSQYNRYNTEVIDYFRNRPEDLLVLNVADNDAFEKLCLFLDKPVTHQSFPWKNKT